jgi:phosphoglycerol transferase MdoB-like AlkP superfamily enzyme
VKKQLNPTWEHFKLLLFILFLCELILLLTALIFGRVFGYKLTLAACFWFGVIVALCSAMIVCANLVAIYLQKLYRKIKSRTRSRTSPNRNKGNRFPPALILLLSLPLFIMVSYV